MALIASNAKMDSTGTQLHAQAGVVQNWLNLIT